jgi:hypothetical protein
MDQRVADPSLELARDFRRAVSVRADALRQVLAEFDVAESFDGRLETSAALLMAINNADREYDQRKLAAVRTFRRRQREAGHGA